MRTAQRQALIAPHARFPVPFAFAVCAVCAFSAANARPARAQASPAAANAAAPAASGKPAPNAKNDDKAKQKTAKAKNGDKARQKTAKAKSSGKTKRKTAKAKNGASHAKLDAKTRAALDRARQLMASDKHDDVEAGIQSLGLLGGAAAVQPLADRIRLGLPPDLLEAAVITLMALAQPEAGPVLYELCRHRRPEIRLHAIEAIVATHPPGAETALVTALSDGDGRVRSAAATGLGELKADGAVEKLFLALDRGNMEASGAIGKVIPAKQVSRLVGYLGTVPLHSLGPALGEVLQRKDVSEDAKLEVVARLEEVGTPEVKGYLNDLVASAGDALPERVSRAMMRAMQEIAE